MEIVKVKGRNDDFVMLCKKLEEFQFGLIPVLQEKGYNLIDDLDVVEGFLMYDDKKPVASIGLKRVTDETCEVVRVFVSGEYRGNGYAVTMIEKIETLARELGYKRAELVTWGLSKSALRLYEKCGYRKGEEKSSEWFGGFAYVELDKNL